MSQSNNKLVISIIGAGGKIGARISSNLLKSDHKILLCEKGIEAKAKIVKNGLKVYDFKEAVQQADITILAVPDVKLAEISRALVPLIRPDSIVILLDPAAAYSKELIVKNDCTYVIIHPCHPPIFRYQETPEARADLFGGIAAKQDMVIALFTGKEEKLDLAEKIGIEMFSPIVNCFRITVEQMTILEPALVEVVKNPAIFIMKEAVFEAIKLGVPEDAAWAFMLGHVNGGLGVFFKNSHPISEGAKLALEYGIENIFKPNWKDIFKPESIKEVLEKMLTSK